MVFVCVGPVHCDNQEASVGAPLWFALFATRTEKFGGWGGGGQEKKRSQRRERAQR